MAVGTNIANGTYYVAGVSGSTVINFNVNALKTRATAIFLVYFDEA